MKNALITFKTAAAELDIERLAVYTKTLYNGGFSTEFLEVLPASDEASFRHSFERFKDMADNLIIAGGDEADFPIKEVICDLSATALVENENALGFAKAACPYGEEDGAAEYARLPADASLVPNILGAFQGFMTEDRDFTLMVLPAGIAEFKQACEKYVLPYLEKKYDLKYKRLVLKYCGEKKDAEAAAEKAKAESGESFNYDIKENCGDITLSLLFEKYAEKGGSEAVRTIVSELKEGLYAEDDVTLSERLFDLLRLKKVRLSTAESFTGGRVVADVVKNAGASDVVYEGIVCYDEVSKKRRLGVKHADLVREGAVSSVVAYQMAVGLLAGGETDLAIATTGLAGPNGDGSGKPVGLCFIAIGMKDGVDVYRFRFNGTREEITETAKNTALFLAIKKLKRI